MNLVGTKKGLIDLLRRLILSKKTLGRKNIKILGYQILDNGAFLVVLILNY